MRTIFIADAHLVAPCDHNYRLLLQFLHELRGEAEELFILGDLFDFWVGFPSNPFRQHDVLIEALLALKQSGCRLVYFEGNHDFHLGPVFREQLAAEVHTGAAVRMVQGRRLFLCHGDQINTADRGYRLLRFLLHNRITAGAVKLFPPSMALYIKKHLQRNSRSSYQAKTRRWDYRQIIRSFADSVRQQGNEGLVTGHFHLAFREELAGSSFIILSLGDWMKHYTYGEMVDGTLLLKSYLPGSGNDAPERLEGQLQNPQE